MTVEEIVTRVKSAIDELTQDGTDFEFSTEDSQNLTRIIVDKIGYGLVYLLEHAPLDKLDGDDFSSLTQEEAAQFTIDANLMGRLRLPADVLRIIDARLSSWSLFPKPEEVYSQVYLMQMDEYARGSWDRPVNIITYNNGARFLEMYCAKEQTDALIFTCIRKPDVSGISTSSMQTTVDVPSKLEPALIYQVAGLTMTAFREEIAQSLFAIARNYMGIVQQQEE